MFLNLSNFRTAHSFPVVFLTKGSWLEGIWWRVADNLANLYHLNISLVDGRQQLPKFIES